MQKIRLNSETEFAATKGHWLGTYNIIYLVILVVVFSSAFLRGLTMKVAVLCSLAFCGGAFLIKQKAAQLKRYGIAEAAFALENELTTKEVGEKVAIFLLDKGIKTTFENEKPVFKGKNASYTFIRYENEECFSLCWDYSLTETFSPGRWQFITDYKELLEETGTIAYYIQQL